MKKDIHYNAKPEERLIETSSKNGIYESVPPSDNRSMLDNCGYELKVSMRQMIRLSKEIIEELEKPVPKMDNLYFCWEEYDDLSDQIRTKFSEFGSSISQCNLSNHIIVKTNTP